LLNIYNIEPDRIVTNQHRKGFLRQAELIGTALIWPIYFNLRLPGSEIITPQHWNGLVKTIGVWIYIAEERLGITK
jgi:hypothetical protein